ncbi:hypothetical protein C8F04DRAFT_1059304 [Mycena alexandri]|uniref:Uncharacterized protein n=1 Tax=Mycena alexandri TaxID=1745969 RepID=A0AAD6TJ49_9AGAR|nr:hypothetical protein C8F04DRAFT_1059304 [Mycena alexandri]
MKQRLGASVLAVVTLGAAYFFAPSRSGLQTPWFNKSPWFTPNPPLNAVKSQPDITAVLLNWVRLANVVEIVSVLCGVDDVIQEVVVWNNNPRPLKYEDFAKTNCSPQKLRIHNSPENLYFQARFIACANASTPYCFIQDDDYLVKPEVIRSLRARIDTHDIYLLPPDESLSSHLLSVSSPSTNITFGFSWLGYGSLILRSNAESFLSLLKRIGASEEENKMADNYYSILRNSVPEVWTGCPIPLGGGGDFTVGEEGVARNRKHIAAATNYLDKIVANQFAAQSASGEWPYVSLTPSDPGPRLERSPCLERTCVLESTIQFLPEAFTTSIYQTAVQIFSREAELATALTPEFISNYANFSLSCAVDADQTTSFRSFRNAVEGDILILDNFDGVQQMNWTGVQWVWLVDDSTAMILKASTYSFSADKRTWVESSGSTSCTTPSNNISSSESGALECYISIGGPSFETARYFQTRLGKAALNVPWRIYETWLRKETAVDT